MNSQAGEEVTSSKQKSQELPVLPQLSRLESWYPNTCTDAIQNSRCLFAILRRPQERLPDMPRSAHERSAVSKRVMSPIQPTVIIEVGWQRERFCLHDRWGMARRVMGKIMC